MDTQTQKYLGPFKITGAVIQDYKTPEGDEVVKIFYENGESELFSKKTFERLVSETPIDLTTLRQIRYQPILEKLAAVLLEENVKHDDIKYITLNLAEKLLNAFDRATSYLWTGDDKYFVPSGDSMGSRTLLEADQILKKISNGDTTGTTKDSN